MESTRQQKIERLIQKDLSDILLRYARALRGTLISVSEVRISPDLSIAHVYLSIFPQDKVASTIAQIQEDTAKIRGEMGHMQDFYIKTLFFRQKFGQLKKKQYLCMLFRVKY